MANKKLSIKTEFLPYKRTNMKKIIILLIITFYSLSLPKIASAEENLAASLAGRILLQVESYGRAWYVDPISLERFYLQDGNEAYFLMRTKGLGITNKDLAKIPTRKGQTADKKLVDRLKGRILLQVEENGEAWYVNPVDGLRYYMQNGEMAYNLMRTKALGISNDNLVKIAMNQNQIVHDTTFNDVAYVKLKNDTFVGGYNADQILPLASLSKLMTALVFLDTDPDWTKKITITQEQIDYPKTLVGQDTTSEVDLTAGDTLTIDDLWVAMLVASSNQAAITIADSTGLSRQDFVKKMNDKAVELGLNKTKFYDASGLDAHNVTTAKEMATLAQVAFSQAKIIEAGQKKEYSLTVMDKDYQSKAVPVADRNYSLGQFDVDASKTGYLIEAQRTVAIKKDNYIVVVLHALSMTQRNNAIKKLIGL